MSPSAHSATYYYDPESELLGSDPVDGGLDRDETDQGLTTAPIFTGDALDLAGKRVFPQRALYGRILAQEFPGFPTKVESPKMYINTNAPFSAVVCGVQGSGKSHSTAVLLESCLIADPRLGTLPAPLSAILFHFDTAAGGGQVQPCEAAHIASLDSIRGGGAVAPQVTVLVLPSNLSAMREVYLPLSHVRVEPLHFAPEDISGARLLAMMKVDQDSQMPLYMESIMTILRDTVDKFDYTSFREELKQQKFSSSQKSMLNLRLALLDSCLKGGNSSNRVARHFGKGKLTIIDLSSPFMDPSSACGFFEMILGLFIEARTEATGKLVVLDEAHKYLTNTGSSARLTDSLLSVVRLQRHLGTRVLISTQEPTIVPLQFLDLCSFIIAHRFSSPRWAAHLKQHVSADEAGWLSKVVSLKTGEGLIFASSGVGLRLRSASSQNSLRSDTRSHGELSQFGQGYLLVRSRHRITSDGGKSILATTIPSEEQEIPNLSQLTNSRLHIGRPGLQSPAVNSMTKVPSLFSPATGSSTLWTPQMNDVFRSFSLPSYGTQNPDGSSPPSTETPFISPASSPPVFLTDDEDQMEDRFRPLVQYLRLHGRTFWSIIAPELRKHQPSPYVVGKGNFKAYLQAAENANLVSTGGWGSNLWVDLP